MKELKITFSCPWLSFAHNVFSLSLQASYQPMFVLSNVQTPLLYIASYISPNLTDLFIQQHLALDAFSLASFGVVMSFDMHSR